MQRFLLAACTLVLGFAAAIAPIVVDAKETVKIVFIGPLSGGNAALGLGGRNSADLAVQLHNADAKAKYTFDMVKLDDQCKPDIGVQVAT
ncbi:MAG TPA: ABC transporter substrate-binding protein, partial [Casimicrobiaceae bacterium]|nr:ABC transporter substrate-binding protein [Casimicrobiaceae bacterium]